MKRKGISHICPYKQHHASKPFFSAWECILNPGETVSVSLKAQLFICCDKAIVEQRLLLSKCEVHRYCRDLHLSSQMSSRYWWWDVPCIETAHCVSNYERKHTQRGGNHRKVKTKKSCLSEKRCMWDAWRSERKAASLNPWMAWEEVGGKGNE